MKFAFSIFNFSIQSDFFNLSLYDPAILKSATISLLKSYEGSTTCCLQLSTANSFGDTVLLIFLIYAYLPIQYGTQHSNICLHRLASSFSFLKGDLWQWPGPKGAGLKKSNSISLYCCSKSTN